MYAHLLTCFPGWTWEYIDEFMTFPRLRDIAAYQADFPPVHVLVGAYMGVSKSSSGKPAELDSEGRSLLDLAPRTVK